MTPRGSLPRGGSARRRLARARRTSRDPPRPGPPMPRRRSDRPAGPIRDRRIAASGFDSDVARELLLELAALGLQVHLQQPGREAREEPHDESGADEVRDRVGHGDVVQEPGLLLGRQVEVVDRLARRADDRRLGEGARHQSRGGPAVVVEDLRGRDGDPEAREAEDHRHARPAAGRSCRARG